MLNVENVTKYYGDFLAVDNLSFSVQKGEIFGLLGVNGAGKTTTFRMILGLLDMTKGKITLDGKNIDYKTLEHIGFVPEERSLMLKMTVEEQAYYIGALKGMKKELIKERLNELLKDLDIEQYRNKPIKELSKGNQQKIQFLVAIINKPKLLILDEPFSGLDPINILAFKKMMLKLKEEGSIIIFSTHRMENVEEFCEKLVILVKGKAVLEGNIKDIKANYLKKNIFIKGNIQKKDLKDIKGVLEINKLGEDLVVKIDSIKSAKNVWEKVSKLDNIQKFLIEDATLDEIFVAKVGEAYEK